MSAIVGIPAPTTGGNTTPRVLDVTAAGEKTPAESTQAATKKISKAGDLMHKLGLLLERNPTTFKAITAKLSNELTSAASKTAGSYGSVLTKLAQGFAQAADRESMQPLQAPSTKLYETTFGSHQQGGHRSGAGILRSFVQGALTQVEGALDGSSARVQ